MSQVQQTQQGQITIPSASAESLGSIQQLLANNLGKEVMAEFVTGIDEKVRKSGTLTAVQSDYLVLFDEVNLADIVCDIYSLKFITFYQTGARPAIDGTGAEPDGAATTRTAPAAREAATVTLAALNYAKRKARKLD